MKSEFLFLLFGKLLTALGALINLWDPELKADVLVGQWVGMVGEEEYGGKTNCLQSFD